MVVLRGKLEIVVVSARDLPNTDKHKRDPDNLTDPFVSVRLVDGLGNEKKIGKTPTIDDNLNPKWFHSIKYDVNQDVQEVRFCVKDQSRLKDGKIGCCSVPTHAFCNERGYEGLLDIITKKKAAAGSLQIKVKFTDTSRSLNQQLSSTRSVKLKGCVPRDTSKRKSQNPANHVHGKMIIKVLHAEKLPNLDMAILDNNNKTDAFVVVYFLDSAGHKTKIATTKTINDDLNPVWNETFHVNVCHEITDIVFTVYDEDVVTNEKIASIEIPSSAITKANTLDGVFDLRRNGKKHGKMKIGLKLQSTKSEDFEVENCLFPLRQGNMVRLYQDAHCPKLPGNVRGSFGNFYEPKSAWMDVQESLMAANNFILITGWSVKTSVTLIRDGSEREIALGRILINKASQGVDVRLLLWDEITSNESKKDGAMATYDNETKDYFKDSLVKVSLALRNRKENSFVQENNYFTKFCYSHHQKTIITDAPIPESRMGERQVIAFVGGLDLTAGRYDTPEHHLFKTLDTEHRHDFYNNVVSTTPQSGPRQPWHDIHGKILGPAAHDVKQNFIDRWNMQGGHDSTELMMSGIDLNYSYKEQDQWSVQIFRSISEDSLSFRNAAEEMLVRKKGRVYDNSLQRAYIHHIQKAEKFIYIENQYFLGSSHFWENCRDIPVKNLIPLEIAAKIATKIKKREEFVAYILIPMFPEGNPEDMAMQEIIHWQFHTIEMMYKMIGDAIRDTGLDTEPQDYLLFFCVGKREGSDAVPNHLRQPYEETAQLAFKNKRSMIYVHSKMAIFDDEYIIVGSANINDRSLGGTRDTEIAMGACQPHVGRNGCGDVGSFRKCLWLEHLGESAPLHMEPGSITCSRKLRQMAEENLNSYLVTDGPLPKGHMLIYPLRVETNGVVDARKDCSQFPDTKASTVGLRSKVIPSELTT